MATGKQIQKKGSSHFTPTPATGMFKPRPFAEPAQPEAATPEVQTKVELGNIGGDRLAGMQVSAPAPIQAKLAIGAPGDKYEQEADTIARKVVRQISAPTPPDPNPNGSDSSVQRQFSAPSIGRLVVQRQEAIEGGQASANLESSINQAKSSGVPLAAPIRRQMEGAFGADFSGVRIHANNNADTLNRELSARAFTTGNNIFFKRGEYDPGSSAGKELLAHELTHVVQQNGSVALKRVQRDINPGEVAAGTTTINTADIDLEKIAHDFIYNQDLTNDQRESLQQNGFQPIWYPSGQVTNAGKGVNYGLLVPNNQGRDAGKVPILAFRGTSDMETTLQDLDWNSPGYGGFQSFLDQQFDSIVQILNTFGYNKVDVTGHSLGGALAQHFTGRFPGNVRRLVTFQSAAPNAAQYQQAVDSVGQNGPEIVHHVAKGDVVDLAGGSHLRGTFYEHTMKGFLNYTPAAHTAMLLNTSDIGGGEGEHRADIKVYQNAIRPYSTKSEVIEAGRIGAIPGGKLALGGVSLAQSGHKDWKRGKFTDLTNWNNTKGAVKMGVGAVGGYLGGVAALVGGGAGVGASGGLALTKAGSENWKQGGFLNKTKGVIKMGTGAVGAAAGGAVGAVGGAAAAGVATVAGAGYGVYKGGKKLWNKVRSWF